jgi:hypothetical protein
VSVFDRRVPPGDRHALGAPGGFYPTDLEHRSFFCPASWDTEHLRTMTRDSFYAERRILEIER